MRSIYKLLSLTACAALLVSLSTFGLTGCRSNDIPTSTPSMPESSSSVPEPSSSSSASSSESSSAVSSEAPSSSKPASSTGGNGGGAVSSAKTYSKAVIDSKKETLKTVKITASDVILSNKTITGDLIIDKGVAKGKVSLNNVTVGKTIYVYGGGENSIYLDDVTAGKLISASTVSRPRIVAKGNTSIGKTEIRYDTLLEYDGLSYSAKGFNQIETVKTSQFLTVLKLYNIGTYSIILSDDTNLFLLGSSSVSHLTANAPAYIEGGEKVGILECNNKDVAIDTAPAYITSKNGTGYYTPEILDEQDNEDDDDEDDDRSFAAPRLSWKESGTVTWSSVSGATHGYEVRINQKGSSLYYAQSFSQNEMRQLNIKEVLDGKLAANGNYEVRVKVNATASVDESRFSNVLSYTYTGTGTALSLTNLAFDNSSNRTQCMLSWVSTGAASYDITVATDSGFRNKVKSYSINDPLTNSTDLRAAMGAAFTARNYWVKVTARTLFDKKEATVQLAVSAAPDPTGLAYNSTTQKVTWSGSAEASYAVSVGDTSSTIPGLVFDLNDTRYPIGATYNITVKRLGSAGNQLDSAAVSLTVTKPGPTALAAPTGVTLNRIDTNKLVLSWVAVPNAQSYTVSLSEDGTPVSGQQNLVVNGATTCTFTTYTALPRTYTATVKASASGFTDSAIASTGTPLTLNETDLNFDAGNGTSASPYQVKTDTQFAQIGNTAPGTSFIQTADFTITAPVSNFSGQYNGNNQHITINIGSGTQDVGLFGIVAEGAVVEKLNIIDGSFVVGSSNVGMIAGENNGTIRSCIISGTASYVTGTTNVGGICGVNTGTIEDCAYNGSLFTTSVPGTPIASPTNTFGMICGKNDGGTLSRNTFDNDPVIGETGNHTSEGTPEGMSESDVFMAARLLPWLGV